MPRFLDDPTAAKFMATLAVDPNPRRRLMVELLARTGMRSDCAVLEFLFLEVYPGVGRGVKTKKK